MRLFWELIVLPSASVALVACVAPTAGAAAPRGDQPMRSCPPTSGGPWGNGTFSTIADDFSVPRAEYWCDADMPTGKASWGPRGLKLSIPDYTTLGSTAWTNSELVSEPQVQTGMSMSARIGAMDLDGVQGSRGWGFWNNSLSNSSRGVALAWFLYQDGTVCPGASCPTGLFVMTERVGSPKTQITFLPTSLLSQTHTYTVTLEKNAVTYSVDGTVVAKITDPEYVPTTPMVTHVWVDNMFYNLLPNFVLAPQLNAVATHLDVQWWWQGPTAQVPVGATMQAATPAVAQPRPSCRAQRLTVRLSAPKRVRVDAVRVLLDGKTFKRLRARRGHRLTHITLKGLPSTGTHTLRIESFSHGRLVRRVSRALKGCAGDRRHARA